MKREQESSWFDLRLWIMAINETCRLSNCPNQAIESQYVKNDLTLLNTSGTRERLRYMHTLLVNRNIAWQWLEYLKQGFTA
jgi:hypothetical protein